MVQQADESRQVDRDERIGEAVENYLTLAEQGRAPTPDDFVAAYPDIRPELEAALEGLALVQGLVGGSPDGNSRRFEAGHRIAGYKIVRELGRGGMGVVYEAVHVDLDRPVALKVLSAPVHPGSRGRLRFLNEAKTAAGLHHTHIVPVFDVGQVGGLCYYAMQRIEGCGLDRVLRTLRRGRTTGAGSGSGRNIFTPTLPDNPPENDGSGLLSDLGSLSGTTHTRASAGSWSRSGRAGTDARYEPPAFQPPLGSGYYRWAARAGQQAAEALAYAHRRGVIHRDIKPSNLLVDAKGTVWVADFGLARRLEDPGLTRSDALVGTPRYMSPEQAENHPIDGRTDVYSLGATLYELLSLRPPFEGKSTAELIRQITGQEPPPLRQFDSRIPRDLETIILKAMAKHSRDRYETAAELADDLGRFLATEPVHARRISPLGRFWRFTKRHPAVTCVSAGAAAVVLTVATVAYVRIVDSRDRALALQSKLATALTEQRLAATEADRAHAKELISQAPVLRASGMPSLREAGYQLLARAAKLDESPETHTRLRDEALEFMTIRDVVPRDRAIPTGRIRALTLSGIPRKTHLATLSEDGTEIRLWSADSVDSRSFRLEPAPTPLPENEASLPDNRPSRPVNIAAQLVAVGHSLVSIPNDGRGLRWLDTETGNVRRVDLGGHVARAMLASGDGRRLITMEEFQNDFEPGTPRMAGFRVLLWDTANLSAPIETLAEAEFQANGRSPNGQTFPRVALDPTGTMAAVGWWNRPEVLIWELESARKVATVETRLNLTALAMGPEGLLAAAGDGKVLLWEVSSDQVVPVPGLSDHHGQTRYLRFSPDGSLLAVAGSFTGAELWHLASNTMITSIPTDDRIGEILFQDDRSLLVTAGEVTSTWEIVEPEARARFKLDPQATPLNLVFEPGGTLIVPLLEGEAHIFRAGGCPTPVHVWPQARNSDVVQAGPGLLAVLGHDALSFFEKPGAEPVAVHPWPSPAPQAEPGRDAEPVPIRLLARTVLGDQVAMIRYVPDRGRGGPRDEGGRGNSPRREGEREGESPAGPPPPDDRRGAEPPRDGPGRGGPRGIPRDRAELYLWSAPSASTGEAPPPPKLVTVPDEGDLLRLARSPWWSPQNAAIAPDGKTLYYLGFDREVHRWVLEGDAFVDSPLPGTPEATCLALSPDGHRLALARESGEVVLLETSTGQIEGEIDLDDDGPIGFQAADRERSPGRENPVRVTAMSFTPDGVSLAIATLDGSLSLWSVRATERNGQPVTTGPRRLFDLPGRRGIVLNLVFKPDGQYLAVTDFRMGEERAVEVWDVDAIRARLGRLKLDW